MSNLSAQHQRDIKGESGRMATALLKHLRTTLIERAVARTRERLEGTPIRFDTIPQTTFDEVRLAYLAILDDPTSLEAIRLELEAKAIEL